MFPNQFFQGSTASNDQMGWSFKKCYVHTKWHTKKLVSLIQTYEEKFNFTPVFIAGFITHGHITVYKPDNSTVADSNNLVCYCFNQGYTSTLKDLQASQETFKEPFSRHGAHKNFEKITLQISAHSIVCVQLRLVSK